ncbi:hypothetical protein Ccrd_008060 [Cynara cardunculus var. scolymus]|uniref:Uncharacterized protein n=1 Tax=Cynara cardunculus var. scolymus TaxID=59895 RepID=A0A103XFX9_CYNCS|nr:hypothetical protein Ccrd_008060 [Cynara cardunculus var. scolymus]
MPFAYYLMAISSIFSFDVCDRLII